MRGTKKSSLRLKDKVRRKRTNRDYGPFWTTRKGKGEAQEKANILVALRPDPPQESEESQGELRKKLVASHRKLAIEEPPIKVGVVKTRWLRTRTLLAGLRYRHRVK